jgi:hypothetical protein
MLVVSLYVSRQVFSIQLLILVLPLLLGFRVFLCVQGTPPPRGLVGVLPLVQEFVILREYEQQPTEVILVLVLVLLLVVLAEQ